MAKPMNNDELKLAREFAEFENYEYGCPCTGEPGEDTLCMIHNQAGVFRVVRTLADEVERLQRELSDETMRCPDCGGRLWVNGAAGTWCSRWGCRYEERPGLLCDVNNPRVGEDEECEYPLCKHTLALIKQIDEVWKPLLAAAKSHQWIYDEIGWEEMRRAIARAEEVLK